jgi:hypothetical protein
MRVWTEDEFSARLQPGGIADLNYGLHTLGLQNVFATTDP